MKLLRPLTVVSLSSFLVAVAIFALWSEGVEEIRCVNMGDQTVEIPVDRLGRPHGNVVHYWGDGRIHATKDFWHGVPSPTWSYIDIVPPDLWRLVIQDHQKRVGKPPPPVAAK